ncbi:hypothetical protein ABZ467_36550 [Streptomyces sp. NPDC005727]|uniref:hypothetical protein n=1 Tax=Streptomyces sp. NPDC005727 TaxID=3157053 RepID=UPI0033D3BC5A
MPAPLQPQARTARLETLRREYMAQIITHAARHRRAVRVVPYVLAPTGPERRADLELIEQYAAQMRWKMTRTTFADLGQPPPLEERPGFAAACRYAAQGYAHGILAIARPALTTDNDTYARVLQHLHTRGLFLTYLPTAGTAP